MRLFGRGERASTLDLLVVGLGNPGREHARDRHNAGWMVVDELARRHDGSFRSKFSGQLSEIRLGDLRLGLLKPETYMNLSGDSLGAAARFYKVPLDSIAVVHDDVDLESGRLQVRLGEGSEATTASSRSSRDSARPTSCGRASASAALGAATAGRSPTTSSRPSRRGRR